MFAKMRMQVGETVISWGAFPESRSINAQAVKRPVRPKFAVIEGGRPPAALVDTLLPLQAQSA